MGIKGFKAFDKDMRCKGFQFKEGEEYEMPDPENLKVCEKGFHLCENPLDVLNYYDLCDSTFAEAEAIGKTEEHINDGKKVDTKIATTRIKIGAKLSLKSFVEAAVHFVLSVCKTETTAASGYSAQLAASGYSAKLAASGDSAKLELNGADSIGAGIGIQNIIRGKKGSWITLAEWKNEKGKWVLVHVATTRIDGKKIKENVWYKLEGKKFKEVKNNDRP